MAHTQTNAEPVSTTYPAWYRDKVFLSAAAVFVCIALARCWSNLPWCDEGWFFNPVYNWLTKGHTGTTVMEGRGFPWDGVERYQYWQPPLHLPIHYAWLALAGLSLPSFRMLSTVVGVVSLLCWFLLLRKFEVPRAVQWLGLGLIATDYAFCRAGSDGRTDMLAGCFGVGGLTAYLLLRERSFTAAVVISQFLVVCGGLTHPIGSLPFLVMIVWFFFAKGDYKRFGWKHLVLAGLPYIAGVAGWGLYIANDPDLFRKIFFGSSASGRLKGFANPFAAFYREFLLRYLVPNGLYATSLVVKAKLIIPVALWAGAAGVMLLRPVRSLPFLRPFITMFAIMFFSLVFLDDQRNGTYLPHITPLYAILIAALAWWAYREVRWARPIVIAALAGFVAVQAGGSLYLIVTNPYHNRYLAMSGFVQSQMRPGDRVVGSAEMGFGLGFDNVRDDMALGYYVGKKPSIIIMDSRYRTFLESRQSVDPPLYAFMTQRLSEYRVGYDDTVYRVYLPKER